MGFSLPRCFWLLLLSCICSVPVIFFLNAITSKVTIKRTCAVPALETLFLTTILKSGHSLDRSQPNIDTIPTKPSVDGSFCRIMLIQIESLPSEHHPRTDFLVFSGNNWKSIRSHVKWRGGLVLKRAATPSQLLNAHTPTSDSSDQPAFRGDSIGFDCDARIACRLRIKRDNLYLQRLNFKRKKGEWVFFSF